MVANSDAVEMLGETFLASSDDGAKQAVLEGGAQSFVAGRNTLDRHAEYLRMHGIAWTPKTYACDKTFRFGNDATNKCTTTTVIPVNFAGRAGHLHVRPTWQYAAPCPQAAHGALWLGSRLWQQSPAVG
jgi:hypothetical protein